MDALLTLALVTEMAARRRREAAAERLATASARSARRRAVPGVPGPDQFVRLPSAASTR